MYFLQYFTWPIKSHYLKEKKDFNSLIAVGFYLSHENWPGSENLSLKRKEDFISLIGIFAVCVYLRLAQFFFSRCYVRRIR